MYASLEPAAQRLFGLRRGSATIKRVHGYAIAGEINEAAGYLLLAQISRNELHKPALFAQMRPRPVRRIWTTGGVLKNVGGSPRRPWVMLVSPLVKKLKFALEELQDGLAVYLHVVLIQRIA